MENWNIRGSYRPDGSYIGYDYGRQVWVDTSPAAQRDQGSKPGSALHPLAAVPDNTPH